MTMKLTPHEQRVYDAGAEKGRREVVEWIRENGYSVLKQKGYTQYSGEDFTWTPAWNLGVVGWTQEGWLEFLQGIGIGT